MDEVDKRLMANPDVMTVFSAAGAYVSARGASNTPTSYVGSATIKLKEDRKHSTQDVIKSVQKDLSGIPGIRANATPYDLVSQILTGGATNMEVDVFGMDTKTVFDTAKQVSEAMRGVAGLESVDYGVQEAAPELQWKVDRQKALDLGVTYRDIADTLSTSTNGDLATYFQEKGFQYPIYVQMPESARKAPSELLNLPITPSLGGAGAAPIKLGQIATPYYTFGPSEITRINRQRYVAVSGRVQDRAQSEVEADVRKALKGVDFPAGTYWDFGRNQKRQQEQYSGLGLAVFLAIALIYMLLASQFESFIYPLIVLTSVPVSVVGVVLALFLTGRSFGLTAFIGILMLIGIVVKNGILLVDYTNQLRGRGMGRDEAILMASPTRLRPILMTTGAAILGMFPLALALGRGSETQAPLATAVIGGLITSTALTLFVVPCVYTVFDDLARRFRKDDSDLAPSTLVGPTATSVGAPGDKTKAEDTAVDETPAPKPVGGSVA
jgi:HAE1 family hydrophobic/amphiphilic exporter-1